MAHKSGTVFVNLPDKAQEQGQTQQEENEEKFEELALRANLVIFEASSKNLLFSSYSNKITICPNRVTISKRGFFTRDEYPMPIENITNARVYTHFFSASLIIETFGIPKPEPIRNMKIDDARLVRRYILALIECKKANLDISDFGLDEIREKLKEIGMVRYTSGKGYHNL